MLPYEQARINIEGMLSNLAAGDRIASEPALARKFGISRPTLRKAIGELVAEGVLCARRGSGTYLRKKPEGERKTRSKIIGLLAPSVMNSMMARIVKGVSEISYSLGYGVLFSHHDYPDPEAQLERLTRMLELNASGALIFAESDKAFRQRYLELLGKLREKGMELAFLDHYFPGFDAPCVMTDNAAGMYMATEHLILLGRRRIALLGFGSRCEEVHLLRRKGFTDALRDYGLDPKPVLEAELGVDGHEEKASEAVAAWLAAKTPFDAIACMEDNMAYGAFLALKAAGLKTPDDVAIVGHDNLDRDVFKLSGLELTSVDQPFEEMGRKATELLVARIEGRATERMASHALLRPKLVIRNSCGAENGDETEKGASK